MFFYRIHVTQCVAVQCMTKTYVHYKIFYSDIHVNDIHTKFKEYSSAKHKFIIDSYKIWVIIIIQCSEDQNLP